jgi:CcmD family protein
MKTSQDSSSCGSRSRLARGALRAAFAALVMTFASTLANVSVAAAQGDAAESRAATFEAAEGAQTEDVPGGSLLVGAYGVIWVLLLGYVVSLAFRQARTASDLERLRQDLEARDPATRDPATRDSATRDPAKRA